MLKIHNNIIFLFILIFVLNPMSGFSQFKRNKKNSDTNPITEQTRNTSTIFADGVREFYSHNYSKAEEIFRSIINSDSKSDPSYFMLSKIKFEQKEYLTAIEYIKKAIDINPKNIWYDQYLATLYDKVEDYSNSVVIWEKVCKKIDNNEYYLYELANAYLKLNKLTDVIRIYDKMEEIIGINEELIETKKNIWLYLNNIEKAVGEYEKLVKLFPFEIKNYIAIGNIYFANNLMSEALTYYKKGEKISPENPDLALAFIEYYTEIKNPEEREKYILQLFKSSNSTEIQLSLIEKEIKEIKKSKETQKIESGIKYCETFLSLNPTNGIVWGYLAQLYFKKEQFPDALIASEKAILYDDISYETWNILISLLHKNSNYSKIASYETQISELFPTQTSLLYVLGIALLNEKEYSRTISVLNSCLLYSFDDRMNSSIYEKIGDSYHALNNRVEAIKYWQLAEKKGNNSLELKEKINSNK